MRWCGPGRRVIGTTIARWLRSVRDGGDVDSVTFCLCGKPDNEGVRGVIICLKIIM